ncbi:MAG TPA: hydantoinase/oxoprolinase family protein [Acidobacteriaceae bacterium]|nr:hydantoinase/oxoprolinase family protein [Acidobacteriaceae bacterium]
MRIGVDTGGTFTDLVCLDEHGLRVYKLRSTPDDPSRAILEGIRRLTLPSSTRPQPTPLEVTHGSTVATNAVLERKGVPVALLTTAGFEDVLRIGRQTRPELYNFMVRRSEPLVSRDLTFGLRERIAGDGSVLEALQTAEVEALIPALQDRGVESVAVCLLHSYRSPEHEQQAAAILRAAGFRVSASHEILPEYREFERWSTTAVNAYVAPLMARYLKRLQKGLGDSTLRVMQSNGGAISAERAGNEAVQTILSGPAAGVIGAQAIAGASGFPRLITFDMGGTSTDVSLVNFEIASTSESLVGDLPVRLPVLDIHTVGAGGGSIAWIDSGGSLRVGPRSAGADPGPVCFGKGDELTVTDANLLLGRLDPAYFLGGRMSLDLHRTQRVAHEFAQRLRLGMIALAEGILRIANANMERAVRVVSVQRGYDPRDFVLLAFGGAGGLHACDLAASLEINTVLVPEHSGVLSALGMLLADVAKDYSASILQPTARLSFAEVHARLDPMVKRAQADLASEGFAQQRLELKPALAVRYKGQAFEIDVPLPPMAENAPESLLQQAEAEFHRRHAQLYGYSDPHRPTEIVQLRLRALGRTEKPSLAISQNEAAATPRPVATKETVFAGATHSTPLYHRNDLTPGMHGEGPAILITGESTNLVPPGWAWRIDAAGSLHLQNGAQHAH